MGDVGNAVLMVGAVVALFVAAAGGIGQLRGNRDKGTIAAQKEYIAAIEQRERQRDREVAELKAEVALIRSEWVARVGHEIAVEVGREVAGAVNLGVVPFLDSLAARVESLEGRRPPTTRSRESD